ncbi:hypothetical protein ACQPZP_14210 [Spirillospora sp. CA-142024]|uniref:hypothetical protein n=1 Tax=Spirillospora sp. CA-142024 TaxID=3240036 RepID=UPI003D8AD71B
MKATRRGVMTGAAAGTIALAGTALVMSLNSGPQQHAEMASAAGKASAAAAAKPPGPSLATYTRPYVLTDSHYSKPLKRCVKTTAWGKISFQLKAPPHGVTGYNKVRLHDPVVRASVLTKCRGGKTAKATSATLVQRWYESSCKASVELSGGIDATKVWSVSVTPTINCGTRKVGQGQTRYPQGSYKTFTQYNSGTKLKFGFVPNASKPLCLSVKTSAIIYVKSKSDSSYSPTMKACVKY